MAEGYAGDFSHFVMVIVKFHYALLKMTVTGDCGRVGGRFFALCDDYC